MSEVINILMVAIGLPILGLTVIFTTLISKNWWLKSRELKIREEQMKLEAKVNQDKMNQLIIESHSHSISTREIETLKQELETLRNEMVRVLADAAATRSTNVEIHENNTDSGRKMQENS